MAVTCAKCALPISRKGLCNTHYMQEWRAAHPTPTKPPRKKKPRKPVEERHCTVDGCTHKTYYGDGMCKMHWMRDYRIRHKEAQKARVKGLPDTPEALWEFVKAELNIK